MRIAIVALIIFVVSGCSARTNTNSLTDACVQALVKAEQLLQLAEQSLQLSAKQIIAVSNRDATQMIQYNDELHDISRQADVVGPEYRQLKETCTGSKG